METYFDTALGVTISHKRALQELASHGITGVTSEGFGDSIEEFHKDLGIRDSYDAQEVLGWLGY